MKLQMKPRGPIPRLDLPLEGLTMQTLRTPDERFDGLDGYPFEPH